MDIFSKSKRSKIMSKIRGKNTKPEIIILKFLFSKGLRFRIHQKDLIEKPDVVLKKYHAVVFINGCFWHGQAPVNILNFRKRTVSSGKPKLMEIL